MLVLYKSALAASSAVGAPAAWDAEEICQFDEQARTPNKLK
jgi:hypothetical protein